MHAASHSMQRWSSRHAPRNGSLCGGTFTVNGASKDATQDAEMPVNRLHVKRIKRMGHMPL